MKPIYVTYTRVLHSGNKARFAVECKDSYQAGAAVRHLTARANVKNVRLNTSGTNLPESSAIFFFHEIITR